MTDIELEILAFFSEDKLIKDMYKELGALYAKEDLTSVFNSLVTLKYLIKTNPRKGKGGSFCISKRGKELLESKS